MSVPKVILLTGIPGAGKTTVSNALASRFERGVAIESDWLQEIIVSGGLWPDEEPHDEAERQLTLKAQNAALLADRFADAGFLPVIDDVIPGTHRLGIYLEALSSRPVVLVVLAPLSKWRWPVTRVVATRRSATCGLIWTPRSARSSTVSACGWTRKP